MNSEKASRSALDERRNKNTPLPTVIRDGKVIMGGDGRTRAQLMDNAHTIVRSDPATSARSTWTSNGFLLF